MQVLNRSFQESRLIVYEIRQTSPLKVVATIYRSASSLTDNNEVVEAQNKSVSELGEAVILEVIVMHLVEGSAAPTDDAIETKIEQTLWRGEMDWRYWPLAEVPALL